MPPGAHPWEAEQLRCDQLRSHILRELETRSSQSAPWGSWCDVHRHLVQCGKANNSITDLRGVQQSMQVLEGFGTIKVDKKRRQTELQLNADKVAPGESTKPNFRVMAVSADRASMMMDWSSILTLAEGQVSAQAKRLQEGAAFAEPAQFRPVKRVRPSSSKGSKRDRVK